MRLFIYHDNIFCAKMCFDSVVWCLGFQILQAPPNSLSMGPWGLFSRTAVVKKVFRASVGPSENEKKFFLGIKTKFIVA